MRGTTVFKYIGTRLFDFVALSLGAIPIAQAGSEILVTLLWLQLVLRRLSQWNPTLGRSWSKLSLKE